MGHVHDDAMPVQPVPYAAVLAANVRGARARAQLTQTSLARRMRQPTTPADLAFGATIHEPVAVEDANVDRTEDGSRPN